MLFSQGLGARGSLSRHLHPSQSWESPRVLLQHFSPPMAWPGLRESTDPPCFSKKTEAQRVLQSFLCYPLAALEQAGTGPCAKMLLSYPPPEESSRMVPVSGQRPF